MKRLLSFCFIGTAILMISETQAHANWIAFAEAIGKDALCNLRTVPGMTQAPKPTTQDHRFTLYLRCEAKGGRDEFAPTSCCDHITPSDSKTIGICPDKPVDVIVPIREAFRAFIQC